MSVAANISGSSKDVVASLRRTAMAEPGSVHAWRRLADHLDATGDRAGAEDAYLQHVRHAVHDAALMSAAAALHAMSGSVRQWHAPRRARTLAIELAAQCAPGVVNVTDWRRSVLLV